MIAAEKWDIDSVDSSGIKIQLGKDPASYAR